MTSHRPDGDTAPEQGAGLWRWAPMVLILAGTVLGLLFLRDYLSLGALRLHRDSLLGLRDQSYGLSVAGFILVYALIAGFSLPGATLATLTGGFLFGTFPGVLYNVSGATLGAVMLFLAVRMGLGDRLAARIDSSEGRIRQIKAGIDDNQWSMLFLIRLVPVVPFFVANLLPALLNVPLRRFAISTFVGIIPGALVYTAIGAGLGETLDRPGGPDLAVLGEPYVFLPLLGLIALAALPLVLKALGGRKGV